MKKTVETSRSLSNPLWKGLQHIMMEESGVAISSLQ
ncbi:hypothetical protein E2320_007993 [Naja naja]|nr:hypothetical protein E2320_007993 [Naja naja]